MTVLIPFQGAAHVQHPAAQAQGPAHRQTGLEAWGQWTVHLVQGVMGPVGAGSSPLCQALLMADGMGLIPTRCHEICGRC